MTTTKPMTALVLLSLALVGCGSRQHLTANHSRSYREAFARQTVNQTPSDKVPKGLDALESGIVVETYRRNLGPAAAANQADQRMILVSPNAGSLGYATTAAAPAR